MKLIKSTLKFIIFFSLAFIIFLLSIVLTLYLLFPKDKIKTIVLSEIQTTLNRKINIKDLSFNISGFQLKDIEIYNKKNNKVEFEAKNITLFISPIKLIQKKIEIIYLGVTNPKINISYNEYFNDNKNSSTKDEKNSKLNNNKDSVNKTDENFSISMIVIKNGLIHVSSIPEKYKNLPNSFSINSKLKIKNSNNIDIKNIEITDIKNNTNFKGNFLIRNINSKDFDIKGNLDVENLYPSNIYKNKDLSNIKKINLNFNNILIGKKFFTGQCNGKLFVLNKTIDLKANLSHNYSNLTGEISNLTINYNNSDIDFNYVKYNLKTNSNSISIKNFKIKPEDFSFYNKKLKRLNGNISGNLTIIDKLANGTVNLNNISYKNKSGDIISDLNSSINIKNNKIFKDKISLKIFNQPSLLSIASKDSNFKNFSFELFISEFNSKTKNTGIATEDDDSITDISQDNDSKSLKIPFNFFGKIKIGTLNIKKERFTNNILSIKCKNNIITIPYFNSTFYESSIKAKGKLDLNLKDPKVNFQFQCDNFKIQKLSAFYPGIENRIYGTSQLQGNIFFKYKNIKNLKDKIKGKIKIQVTNGKMIDTGIQNKLILVLKPLRYKLKDLEFNNIMINLVLDNDLYIVNNFKLYSEDIRFLVTGSFKQDLSGQLNYVFEFNNNFIKDLPNPVFVTLKPFKKGSWYHLDLVGKGKNVFKKIKLVN